MRPTVATGSAVPAASRLFMRHERGGVGGERAAAGRPIQAQARARHAQAVRLSWGWVRRRRRPRVRLAALQRFKVSGCVHHSEK